MTEVDKRYVKASNSASFCRIQNTKKLTWFLETGGITRGKKTKCLVELELFYIALYCSICAIFLRYLTDY